MLLATSYVAKNRYFLLFVSMITYLLLASITNITQHDLFLHITDGDYTPIYVMHILYHIFLFSLFLVYIVYFVTILDLDAKERVPIMSVSTFVYICVILADIYTSSVGTGFRINENGQAVTGVDIFLAGYFSFVLIIVFLIIAYGKRVYRNSVIGIISTMIIAMLVLFNQGRHSQSTFTVATFLFPTIAILYLLHSNPYGVKTGAVNSAMLSDSIKYYYSRRRPFYFFSVYLHNVKSAEETLPDSLLKEMRQFPGRFFKKAIMFKLGSGHFMLLVPGDYNTDFEEKSVEAVNAFLEDYEKYHIDYKVIIGSSIDEISERDEYVTFLRSIQRRMPYNTVYRVQEGDVEEFNRFGLILKAIEDISKKHDLNDERVLAFYQPVFNVITGKYDTAEALMRLNLPGLGMIFPDQFIRIAEDYGYIHSLTKIILNKTCLGIKEMLEEGYEVNRISVNVTVMELREGTFIDELDEIIKGSGIPSGKIAIEITESQSESDMLIITKLVERLRKTGVKLYLDDFGTGYSNMERIMKLPFDIIKFDRSLVLASKYDKKSELIVARMAKMFADLDYSVLYEGVESDKDESRCISMSASYLQGFKYSRPVPLTVLKQFFSKKVDEE